MTGLVDRYGQPLKSVKLDKTLLTRDIAGPSIGSVRTPIAGYPSDGLDPVRLAGILREADAGEPTRFFELAEIIEERDLHYAGVLATRKRSVAQIDVTVEAASDAAADVAMADMVRDWLKRDELADETFDLLDAIGKGVSFTEIVWEASEGQYRPARLEWRDPRWLALHSADLTTLLLRGGLSGVDQPCALPYAKFIVTRIKAKSGLPVRSGVARLAAWSWMFKAYTQRDWAIFTQTYGQPVRVGRFHENASKEDKDTLFRAVANIAGDCAAIIPKSMEIEFIESKNVTAGSDLYERRADWLDRQVSKAVLGQTTTTDAVSGGHAVSQEHRKVQEDIEVADCKALAAALNRDLIRVWIDLEFGPQKAYPRLLIGRPQQEDLKQLTDSLGVLVPLGLKVQASEVRDKLGLAEPEDDTELLQPRAPAEPAVPGAPGVQPDPQEDAGPEAEPEAGPEAEPEEEDALREAQGGREQPPALQAQQPHDHPTHPADAIAAAMAALGDSAVAGMIDTVEAMLARAGDLGEFRAWIETAFGDLDDSALAAALAGGAIAAHAAGRSDLIDESEEGAA